MVWHVALQANRQVVEAYAVAGEAQNGRTLWVNMFTGGTVQANQKEMRNGIVVMKGSCYQP